MSHRSDRTERDRRIISLMLYLVRNLLAIRDPIGSGTASGETMELGSLQSRLLVQMEQARFMPLLLTLAENADKGEYEDYNVLVLDMLWLIFRAVEVEDLIRESKQVSSRSLRIA
jgi:replication fork protection complex subunit Tof1/Swi1